METAELLKSKEAKIEELRDALTACEERHKRSVSIISPIERQEYISYLSEQSQKSAQQPLNSPKNDDMNNKSALLLLEVERLVNDELQYDATASKFGSSTVAAKLNDILAGYKKARREQQVELEFVLGVRCGYCSNCIRLRNSSNCYKITMRRHNR